MGWYVPRLMAGWSDYAGYDAVGLAELVRTGEASPEELAEAAIDAAERVNPRLNAIVTPMFDEARQHAADLPDGALRGVPLLVKDLGPPVAGQRFTRGSRLCAQQIADHDGELVRRYRRAGLNIVGKTNTPELGLLPVTEPELFGPTENPWALGRTAGGSSGRSAAAVAAVNAPVFALAWATVRNELRDESATARARARACERARRATKDQPPQQQPEEQPPPEEEEQPSS